MTVAAANHKLRCMLRMQYFLSHIVTLNSFTDKDTVTPQPNLSIAVISLGYEQQQT
jgi:hypothetical protein